ncbi:MAG TPA: CsgG/HfaB family protein [bacterium]
MEETLVTYQKFFMKILILFFISISPLIAQQESQVEKITLAVMDFKNNSAQFRHDRLEKAIPEMLKTELSYNNDIVVVERSKIESILAEQALAQSGVIETTEAQEVGRLAGAQYIITGEVNTINNRLRIDAHIIKVSSGQVLGEKVNGNDRESLEPMVKLLAQNIIFNLTGKGARKSYAKIQDYHSKWAVITTGAASIATVVLHVQYKNYYDKYHETDHLDKFDRYYSDANRYYKTRNIFMIASGIAAITALTLWQNDRSEMNKIYADNQIDNIPKTLSIGLAMENRDYLLSLHLSF